MIEFRLQPHLKAPFEGEMHGDVSHKFHALQDELLPHLTPIAFTLTLD